MRALQQDQEMSSSPLKFVANCEGRGPKAEWLSVVTDFLHKPLVLQTLLVRRLHFVVVRYEQRTSYCTETINFLHLGY